MLRSAALFTKPAGRQALGASARFLSGLPTADLCDKVGLDSSKVPKEKSVSIVDPALNFKNYGANVSFSGQIVTIKTNESNPLVRKLFESPGDGRVLVVDNGGSMRCAMLGDNIAEAGVKNGWAGIVIFGCIRDSGVIAKLPIGVKALNTIPVKSHKNDPGLQDIPVKFGGVTFETGMHLYADQDGIILSDKPLSLD